MEAVFRATTPHSQLCITYPVYAPVNSGIESERNIKGGQEIIGTSTAIYILLMRGKIVTRSLLQIQRILSE